MERNGTRLNGDQAAESPPRFDWRHGKTLSFSLSLLLSLTYTLRHHRARTLGRREATGARRQARGDMRAGLRPQVQQQQPRYRQRVGEHQWQMCSNKNKCVGI